MLNAEKYTRQALGQIRMWQGNGSKQAVQRAAAAVRDRLFDLSAFVKELKHKFSVWFNRRGETARGGQAKAKAGFSRERIEAELARGGTLPMWKLLRCRVRYFADGTVLGSRAFVDGFFEHERSRFGPAAGVWRAGDGWW